MKPVNRFKRYLQYLQINVLKFAIFANNNDAIKINSLNHSDAITKNRQFLF